MVVSALKYGTKCTDPLLHLARLNTARTTAKMDKVKNLTVILLTCVFSTFKANTLANWNAVSRQIWRGCHTSVDSGDLSQAPPKQSAVCSTCIIPAPPANCRFIWMASALRMSATQLTFG